MEKQNVQNCFAFLHISSFPQLLNFARGLVEEAARDGRSRRSPDRTHDHHRGQRRQSAGALRCMMIYLLFIQMEVID